MFSHITDFSYQRTRKQAVGFYIAYLILTVLIGGLAGGIIGVATEQSTFEQGLKVGDLTATAVVIILGFIILHAKGRLSHFGYLVLVILSGIITIFGGGILGFLVTAYLTTRPIRLIPATRSPSSGASISSTQ